MQNLFTFTTRGLKEAHYVLKTQCPYVPRNYFTMAQACNWPTFLSRNAGTCVYVHSNVKNMHNDNLCQNQTSLLSDCAELKKHMKLIESASSEHFDEQFAPSLHCAIHHTTETEQRLVTVGVVPGKGPPPEPPIDCCMSGCANCVWIAYAEALKDYYSDGGISAKLALEQIDNPSLKMFVKLELGLL